jgi:protein involved in polysaccharide export with SLBB domain/capsular polysaccharide biosynthesis protein
MTEPENFSVGAVQKKRLESAPEAEPVLSAGSATAARAASPAPKNAAAVPAKQGLPFDAARLAAAALRRWKLPLKAGAGLMLALALWGYWKIETGYKVVLQLIRREVSTTIRASQLGDPFKPRQVTAATIVSVMGSPDLLDRVGALARPPMTGTRLFKSLDIKPERDSDVITITLKTTGPAKTAADFANRYAEEVVAVTAKMQADEARELEKFLGEQMARTDADLAVVNKDLAEFSKGTEFYGADREVEAYLRELGDLEVRLETSRAESQAVDFRIAGLEGELARQSPAALDLGKARDALASLRIAYTDENPVVKDAREKVAALEKQLAGAKAGGAGMTDDFRYTENTVANELYIQLIAARGQRETLAKGLAQMGELRKRVGEKLKSIPEKSQRYANIVARQQSLQAAHDLLDGRAREARAYAENSQGLYRLFAKATEDTVEIRGRAIKIVLFAIAGFVLGAGGSLAWICLRELLDLRVVSAGDLRRVTGAPVALRLPDTAGLGPAELAGWRFRAWSQLLRRLGLQNESRVAIAFMSACPGEGKSSVIGHLRDAARERGLPVVTVTNAPPGGDAGRSLALADALATPELVARRLRERPGVPLDLLFDGAWAWTLENRAKWQRAFEAWRQIPVLALLVELPSTPGFDAVLAAELMPAVVWVAASGRSQQGDLASAIENLKAGEVALSAAVLNREPAEFSKLAALGAFGLGTTVLLCVMPLPAVAETNDMARAEPSLSATVPSLAEWQRHFTVGAGDIFHMRIYGRTDSVRIYVPVGPDGRISFMEAQSVPVAGLTVDEMRARLDAELGKYYRNARVVVTPVEWHSKKYFLLGAVMDRGAYSLDRPLTIIEAVARARGIAPALFEHNTVELADMTRAFVVRGGKRAPVDFDRLFNHGDLSQNILIEPNDYIYIPSGTVNQVYVLGAVRAPGVMGLTTANTIVGVLTARGGFMPEAFKQRVLVVRGSLEKPETFVVNVSAILRGKEKDFILKPRDIIYVSEKPWQFATELSQVALNSFVQSMTASWVGNNIQPVIQRAILPRL